MNLNDPTILVINGGSSSIRFGVFSYADKLVATLRGTVERIGLPGTNLTYGNTTGGPQIPVEFATQEHQSSATRLITWLENQPFFSSITAVGHRIVHGMAHTEPTLVTPSLLADLHHTVLVDPDHLPSEIKVIEILRTRHPDLPNVVCFDTAFHHTMPRVASMLPIPRHYAAKGIRRYGFHGLSYAYLIEELARLNGVQASAERVVLAHLGNGASLAAVLGGHSIDTSMAFTPAAGIPMSTRSGDVDPGLASYLARTEHMSPESFDHMINHESGLLGISETTSDMRDLLAHESTDSRADEAVAMFCYQAKKYVGAYAAALGGLDTLVFSGGIGTHAAPVRTRICAGLAFLGIELDAARNTAHAAVISTDASRVIVRVIPTDEEYMIARAVFRMLNPHAPTKNAQP